MKMFYVKERLRANELAVSMVVVSVGRFLQYSLIIFVLCDFPEHVENQ